MSKTTTWRILFQVDKDSREVCHSIGVDSEESMYRVVRHLAGRDADRLYSFEAHQLLEGGKVKVIRGGSHPDMIVDADDKTEVKSTADEKEVSTAAVVPLLPPPPQKEGGIKEGAVKTYPFRLVSLSEVLQQCRT